jgi:sirohydrochlorin cobaltochelatase
VSESAHLAPPEHADWLTGLPIRIGQILIQRDSTGGFQLCHRDDQRRDDLRVLNTPESATELARHDDTGKYRPLKTAPNLRHGWRLLLADRAAVRLAVDLFYPGRAAAYEAFVRGKLRATAFRETLARQTGMYRAAANITDEQANVLIANFCRSDGGCLRTILWRRDVTGGCPSTLLPADKFDPRHDQTGRAEPTVPLLCQEICSLVVAGAREAVKGAK